MYDLIYLEKDWFFSVNNKQLVSVSDKILVYDFYNDVLYEINDFGEYILLGEEVIIFDENGEQILF